VGIVVERHLVALPAAKLALVLHLPDMRGRVPCVVACHGLHASKDSDKYLLLGDALPPAGLALARFDFRGCGESSGREDETTIASRIEDVEAVLALLEGREAVVDPPPRERDRRLVESFLPGRLRSPELARV